LARGLSEIFVPLSENQIEELHEPLCGLVCWTNLPKMKIDKFLMVRFLEMRLGDACRRSMDRPAASCSARFSRSLDAHTVTSRVYQLKTGIRSPSLNIGSAFRNAVYTVGYTECGFFLWLPSVRHVYYLGAKNMFINSFLNLEAN
jgi:hypothetical protein